MDWLEKLKAWFEAPVAAGVEMRSQRVDEATMQRLIEALPTPDGPCWFLDGKIVEERSYGPGGVETRAGTKPFAPGARVHCLPPCWHDGYEYVRVIGRPRGTKRFSCIVMRAEHVTSWEARLVYSPTVLAMAAHQSRQPADILAQSLDRLGVEEFRESMKDRAYQTWWESEAQVFEYVERMQAREKERANGA